MYTVSLVSYCKPSATAANGMADTVSIIKMPSTIADGTGEKKNKVMA